MGKWKLIVIVLASVVIPLGIVGSLVFLIKPLFTAPEFPSPTGMFGVGTTLIELNDEERINYVTNQRGRRIPVRIFYPIKLGTEGNKLVSMDNRVAKAFSELYKIPAGIGEESFCNSIMDANILDQGPFPVIIFSHGGFSYSTQNLSTCEELASFGYIVVVVDHTNESVASIFPNGETLGMADKTLLSKMQADKKTIKDFAIHIEKLKSDRPHTEKEQSYNAIANGIYKDLEPYLKNRIEDIHSLLSFINEENSNQESFLFNKIDLKKVGMFGHSFGGVTTSYICSEEDSIVSSGINLDGPVLNFSKTPLQLQKPFAFFYSTHNGLGHGVKLDMTGSNSYYAETNRNKTYSIRIEGTAHYNYSDFNFMPKFFQFTPMLGSIDPLLMSKILNQTIVEFFNMTLNYNNKDSNIFNKEKSEFKELFFL